MRHVIRKILLIAILIFAAAIVFFNWQFQKNYHPLFGINFSTTRAAYLGFPWEKMFQDILTDLKPQRMRVMAYWEIIEPERGKFDFADLDYILTEAGARNIKVILTLGHKQPGWPECHHPKWYESLSEREREKALMQMLEQAVGHFKKFSSVVAWQVENEPFFVFGPDCPRLDEDLLRSEIALVKSLDSRPVVVTDSGEKGTWLHAASFGDIFGATMYRTVYQGSLRRYITYPLPPLFYRVRAGILQTFSDTKTVIGPELQAEPWFSSDVFATPWKRQKELMNERILARNAQFARDVGFAENYFWGVEWWYYGKEKHNDPELWNLGKKLLSE